MKKFKTVEELQTFLKETHYKVPSVNMVEIENDKYFYILPDIEIEGTNNMGFPWDDINDFDYSLLYTFFKKLNINDDNPPINGEIYVNFSKHKDILPDNIITFKYNNSIYSVTSLRIDLKNNHIIMIFKTISGAYRDGHIEFFPDNSYKITIS